METVQVPFFWPELPALALNLWSVREVCDRHADSAVWKEAYFDAGPDGDYDVVLPAGADFGAVRQWLEDRQSSYCMFALVDAETSVLIDASLSTGNDVDFYGIVFWFESEAEAAAFKLLHDPPRGTPKDEVALRKLLSLWNHEGA